MKNILDQVKNNREYMLNHKNYLHRFPEVSAKEFKTVAYLENELTALGIRFVTVGQGGILGFIEGGKPGKTVLLRADIDALPMQEDSDNLKTPKAALSENEGACHSCGHDAHMAMLLAAAKILNEQKSELNGNIVLMFERGEEGPGNVVELHKYIEQEKITIDSAYGIHVYADLEEGKISLAPGPVMSGIITYDLTIAGRGGHGSRPDQSNSPIEIFAAINYAMSGIRMNKISPFTPFTASVGYVKSGTVRNIIPDTLLFGGTVRLFDQESGTEYRQQFEKILEHTSALYGCEITGAINGPRLAVINDPECAQLAKDAVSAAVSPAVVRDIEPWMASESMGLTLSLWPGVFALVGIANEEKGYGASHHNAKFDLGEDAMVLGATSAIAYATAFLAGNIDTTERKWKGTTHALYQYSNRPQKFLDFLEGKIDVLEY